MSRKTVNTSKIASKKAGADALKKFGTKVGDLIEVGAFASNGGKQGHVIYLVTAVYPVKDEGQVIKGTPQFAGEGAQKALLQRKFGMGKQGKT